MYIPYPGNLQEMMSVHTAGLLIPRTVSGHVKTRRLYPYHIGCARVESAAPLSYWRLPDVAVSYRLLPRL